MNRLTLRFVAFLVTGFILAASSAFAHFNLNQNVRVFHVLHDETGLVVLLRTPMPYMVGDKVGAVGADGRTEPAPFTVNEYRDGVLLHMVDPEAIIRDPLGLANIILDEMVLRSGGIRLSGEAIRLNVHPLGTEPGFATKDEALAALADSVAFSEHPGETFVGDAVVDVLLKFENATDGSYTLSMLSNPGLAQQDQTANLILDYRDGGTRTYRATGLLTTPVEVTGTFTSAASTFVVEGIRHILEGIDHVLFVLCMVIGALNLHALLARVTGFTLGHSVTLIMGFFGLAPSAPWFIPAVETAIALTIILAAADAVFQNPDRKRSGLMAVGVTAGVGLLHGFGFSFMLREILQVDADNVWQSLLAFNIGVEIGQLIIVLLVWPVVVFLRKLPPAVWDGTRGVIAASISIIAAFWAFERFAGVIA